MKGKNWNLGKKRFGIATKKGIIISEAQPFYRYCQTSFKSWCLESYPNKNEVGNSCAFEDGHYQSPNVVLPPSFFQTATELQIQDGRFSKDKWVMRRNLYEGHHSKVPNIEKYMDEYGVQEFDRSVDFGWFYFLTKPIFHVLEFIFGYVGNFGWAIIIFTLLMRICFFPLAQASFKSMAKMKKLSPELQRLKEQYGDDRAGMQKEMMALYKREKANPIAGCLPILLQIPVFFALYKVFCHCWGYSCCFFKRNGACCSIDNRSFNWFFALQHEPSKESFSR